MLSLWVLRTAIKTRCGLCSHLFILVTIMKKIAVINDISGFGRCSLTAALPVISSLGVQCCPLITGVYSNQTGYNSYKSVDLTGSMQDFIDEWKKLGARFDGIITGFITNARQGEIISQFIDDFGSDAVVAVDPIMADDGEVYDGFDDKRINAVKALCRKADIITPNLHELCILVGREFSPDMSDSEIEEAAVKTGVGTVIVTGIKRVDTIETAVLNEGVFKMFSSEKRGGSFSGTGDVLVSFVTAAVVNGENVFEALKKACSFIEQAIELTLEETPEVPYRAEGIHFEKLIKIIDKK